MQTNKYLHIVLKNEKLYYLSACWGSPFLLTFLYSLEHNNDVSFETK